MCSLSKYKKPCGHRQCWTQTFCRMIVQGKSILLVTKAIILKNSLSSRSRRCGRCIISQKLIILNSLCWPWPFHVRYFSHSPSGGEIFRPLASNFVRCFFLIVRIFLLHCMKGMRNGWSKENSPYLLQLWLENRIICFWKFLKIAVSFRDSRDSLSKNSEYHFISEAFPIKSYRPDHYQQKPESQCPLL